MEPELSATSKLVGWNQPKSNLSVAVLKSSTVLEPHDQVIVVVVPPCTGYPIAALAGSVDPPPVVV